ncbi:MAG: hypothetical protein ABR592_08825 [Nitriliruptorales bacterium]
MVAGHFRLPPELGAPLVNRIDAQTDREYRRAWRQGGRESRAAYAADALVKLLSGQGAGSPSRADVVVVVDLEALRRGHPQDGERCHFPGVGPLPADLARRMASDAFLKAVVVDGCEIKKVKHFGPPHPRRGSDCPRPGEAARVGRGGMRGGGLRPP